MVANGYVAGTAHNKLLPVYPYYKNTCGFFILKERFKRARPFIYMRMQKQMSFSSGIELCPEFSACHPDTTRDTQLWRFSFALKAEADRLEKSIKREQRMDSTCKKTVTSSSLLSSCSPSYFTVPQSFSLGIPLKVKVTIVQKFVPHSSMMCQGRHTFSLQ